MRFSAVIPPVRASSALLTLLGLLVPSRGHAQQSLGLVPAQDLSQDGLGLVAVIALVVVAGLLWRNVMNHRLLMRQLEESKARYKGIFETIMDGYYKTDLSGAIQMASPSALEMVGCKSLADVQGLNIAEHFYKNPEDRQRLIGELKEKGEARGFRLEVNRKDGKTLIVETNARLIMNEQTGAPEFIEGVFRDVTEQQAAAQRMENVHALLMKVLNGVEADIYVADIKTYEVLFVNQHMLESFGPGLLGKKCHEVFRRLDSPCPHCTNDKIFNEKGEPLDDPYVWECQNPVTGNWYLNHDRAIEWMDGRLARMQLATDISEQKELQRKYLRAMEKAETANVAKSEFLANMSHEMRTPLNGVMGMLQLLQDPPLEGDKQELVDIALESSTNLLSVINDVLDLSRVESGTMSFRDEVFTLSAVLDSVQKIFATEISAKGVELSCFVAPDVPKRLRGDPVRLRQILLNLVGNAIKFTEVGTIRVEVMQLGFDADQSQSRMLFTVSDSGIGIPDDKIDYVFQPFTQADGTFSRKFGGAGLGLGIVTRFIKLLGGNMAVESEDGKGTTVYITLPMLVPASPVVEAENKPRPHKSVRGLRILVAEDEPVNRLAALRFIEHLGHSPLGVGDGQQALDALGRETFDCVLMDIQMPTMDGLQATRIIRRSDHGDNPRSIPIIAMTAHAMAGDREHFLQAGMDGYVSKPVDILELADVLNSLGSPTGEDEDSRRRVES